MRFEIIPEFSDDKPYSTAAEEIGYRSTWMWVTSGTAEEVLARAKAGYPNGKAFQIEMGSLLYPWSNSVRVNYEEPYSRWFVEITTMEELLDVIKTLGIIYIEDNVIKEYVE